MHTYCDLKKNYVLVDTSDLNINSSLCSFFFGCFYIAFLTTTLASLSNSVMSMTFFRRNDSELFLICKQNFQNNFPQTDIKTCNEIKTFTCLIRDEHFLYFFK